MPTTNFDYKYYRSIFYEMQIHNILIEKNPCNLLEDGSITFSLFYEPSTSSFEEQSRKSILIGHSTHDIPHLQKIPFMEAIDIIPEGGIQMNYHSVCEMKSCLLETDFCKKLIEYHKEMNDLVKIHQSTPECVDYIKIWSNGKITNNKNEIICEICFPKNTFHFPYVEDYETFTYVDKKNIKIFVEKRNEIVKYLKSFKIKHN